MIQSLSSSSLRPQRKSSRLTIGIFVKDDMGDMGAQNRQWCGAQDAAKALDVNLITFVGGVLESPRNIEVMPNVLCDLINPGNVDGLIIWSVGINWYISKEKLEAFCRRFAPLPVLSGEVEVPGLPCVLMDDYQGMREVMEHLIKTHGYRRIAFLRGSDNHAGAQERYRAYVETLRDYSLPADPQLVSPVTRTWDGAAMMTCLLDEQHADFEAVVAASDYMMLYALRVLRERNLRVPEDVAIAAFDNLMEGRTLLPPLTTVDPPFYSMGRRAVELMVAWLQGGQIPEREVLHSRAIVRQSCGCWPQTLAQAVVPETALPQQWLLQLNSATGDALRRRGEAALIAALGEGAAALPPDWAARVWEAFNAEVKKKDARTWVPVLNGFLYQTAVAGGDAQIWQEAILGMRSAVRPALAGRSLARAEDLWQQGRTLVADFVLGVQGRVKFREEVRMAALQNVSQTFMMTFDIPQLMEVVARELPLVGIRSCYLAFYERSTEHTGSARLMLAYTEDGRVELEPEGRRFPAPELLPAELWPAQKRFDLMLKALYFQQEQIGFMLLSTGLREGPTYDVLSGQISSALKGALLQHERNGLLSHLNEIATHDELTGLYNRREIIRRLEEEILRAQRFGHPFGLVMFDIDHFKAINDTHGHQVGDQVLKWMGQQLMSNVRLVDYAARYGGDEFLILSPETTVNEAYKMSERLRQMIIARPFAAQTDAGEALAIPVTISIGVVELSQKADSKVGILETVDRALYAAKQQGRNCIATIHNLD